MRKFVIAQGAKNHIFIVGEFINDQAILMEKSNAACPIVHCQKHIHTTTSHVHILCECVVRSTTLTINNNWRSN